MFPSLCSVKHKLAGMFTARNVVYNYRLRSA